MSQWSGYSKEELLTMNPLDLLGDESKRKFEEIVIEAMKGEKTFFSSEYEIRTKNGQSVWGLFHARVNCKDGKPDTVQVFVQDITERKKAEEALRESEERFSKAFLANPTAMAISRLDGQIVDVNDGFEKLMGYNRGEVIDELGRNLSLYALVYEREKLIQRLKEKGRVSDYEIVLRHKTGKPIVVILSLEQILLRGQPHFLGAAVDITKRKKIEEELRKSEQLYRTVFDNSDDGFQLVELICDENGKPLDERMLMVNRAFEKQTGVKANELVGKKVSELNPSRETHWSDKHYEVLKTGKPTHVEVYINYAKKYFDAYIFPYSEAVVGILFRDITERKKTEEMLVASEQRFHEFFEKETNYAYMISPDGIILDLNFSAIKALGYSSKSEIVGKPLVTTIYAPNSQDRARHLFLEWKKTGKLANEEITVITKTGQERTVILNASAVRDKEGKLLHSISIQTDITERKKAEETLRMEKERFESLANSLPEIVFEADINGKLVFGNKRGFEITGYTLKEFAEGFNIFNLIAPQDKEKAIEHFNKTLKNQPSIDNEFTVLRKDGSTFPAIIVANLIIDKERPIGLRGIVIDITERKKAEAALRASEEKFFSMFEQSPAIFEIYDKNGVELQVNRAWDKLWNIPRESVIGKYNVLKSKQIEETGWLPLLKKVFFAGETVFVPEKEFDASLEPEGLGKGRKRWLRSLFYPIKNSKGEITNVVFMHEDVTEKKILEDKLQDKERMATIGQTAGMVGHDLRNPLQSIAGEVYLAKSELDSLSDGESKSCLQESIQTIESQVSYMDKIVSDLQTFVKPVEAQIQIINLKPLITSLFAQTEIPKNIQANIEVQEALIAEADPQLLKRVLINLVTNAVQAMPEGGELTIEAQAKDKKVQIIVEDTGTGIPEEIKPKIFTPLFTTKSKGQGFGLAVCKRVIEAQHGTITFESQVGKGTKFIVELPINEK